MNGLSQSSGMEDQGVFWRADASLFGVLSAGKGEVVEDMG